LKVYASLGALKNLWIVVASAVQNTHRFFNEITILSAIPKISGFLLLPYSHENLCEKAFFLKREKRKNREVMCSYREFYFFLTGFLATTITSGY
jgi:hypothetical protein